MRIVFHFLSTWVPTQYRRLVAVPTTRSRKGRHLQKSRSESGFFDRCEGAYDRKLLDTNFLLSWLPDASGVDQFDGTTFVAYDGPVEVARRASNIGDYRLLFARKTIEETTFADIWPANQGDTQCIFYFFGNGRRN